MTKPINPPTNGPHCFLGNMASIQDQIALRRMGMEWPIQTCKKAETILVLRLERTGVILAHSDPLLEVEKPVGRTWG
jgi:hypothetical protein